MATARRAADKESFAAVNPPGAWHYAALLGGNIALAFGPWLVRLADTGPVSTGFWRLFLPIPLIALLALAALLVGLWFTVLRPAVKSAAREAAEQQVQEVKTAVDQAQLGAGEAREQAKDAVQRGVINRGQLEDLQGLATVNGQMMILIDIERLRDSTDGSKVQ